MTPGWLPPSCAPRSSLVQHQGIPGMQPLFLGLRSPCWFAPLGVSRESICLPVSCVTGGFTEDSLFWVVGNFPCLPVSSLGQLNNLKLSCSLILCSSHAYLLVWNLVHSSYFPHPAFSKCGSDVDLFSFVALDILWPACLPFLANFLE